MHRASLQGAARARGGNLWGTRASGQVLHAADPGCSATQALALAGCRLPDATQPLSLLSPPREAAAAAVEPRRPAAPVHSWSGAHGSWACALHPGPCWMMQRPPGRLGRPSNLAEGSRWNATSSRPPSGVLCPPTGPTALRTLGRAAWCQSVPIPVPLAGCAAAEEAGWDRAGVALAEQGRGRPPGRLHRKISGRV